MTFKLVVEIYLCGLLVGIMYSLWLAVLVKVVTKVIIQGFFSEKEAWMKRMLLISMKEEKSFASHLN